MTDQKFDYGKDEWANEYQRSLARWQECTCRPQDALLCPACLRYTREKYGESIPIQTDKGEVIP